MGSSMSLQHSDDLHAAVWNDEFDEAARILAMSKLQLEIVEENGNTALHFACFLGNAEMAKLLINNGARVNCTNNFGFTPLHFAAWKQHENLGIWLVEQAGAYAHRVDLYGRSVHDLCVVNKLEKHKLHRLAALLRARTKQENLLALRTARMLLRGDKSPLQRLPVELCRLVGGML